MIWELFSTLKFRAWFVDLDVDVQNSIMHIISRKRLVLFALTHADSEAALDTWYRTAKSAEWQNLIELREAYPSADPFGIYTVFNIKGNHYRLIAEINSS
jgi:mRNA interferase HigB